MSKFKVGDRVIDHENDTGTVVIAREGSAYIDVVYDDPSLGLMTSMDGDAFSALVEGRSALDVPFALVPGGKSPVRATEGAAAVDLFARIAPIQDKDVGNWPLQEHYKTSDDAGVWSQEIPAIVVDSDHLDVHVERKHCGHFAPVGDVAVVGSTQIGTMAVRVPLGVRFAIPAGHVGLLFSRSSLGKRGLVIPNGVGVIDSDYRGEVCALLQNLSGEDVVIRDGERIAQLVILPLPAVAFREVAELDDTARGEAGFGSTGSGEVK